MNGVYSVFRVQPKVGKIMKHRLGRFTVTPEGVKILEDYHGHFLRNTLPESSTAGETQSRLASLMRNRYLEVRPWDDHLGDQELEDIPEEPMEQPMIPTQVNLPGLPPSVFQYTRVGFSKTHIVEAHGDHLILDGNTLSPQESMTILQNVAKGLATLRYHRPNPKGTPHIPGRADYLGKSEDSSVPNLKKDPMIPRLGNLAALAERTEKDIGNGMVVALDINDFWRANEIGWKEGDEAIVAFGEILAKAAGGDAYRDGGDGFVAFFETREEALVFIRKLTEAEKELPPVGGNYKITISAGAGETLSKAKTALEIAKQSKYRDSSDQANDSVYVAGSDLTEST